MANSNLDLDLQCVSAFNANADPYSDPATQIIKWILTDPDLQPFFEAMVCCRTWEKKFCRRAVKSYSMPFKIHHQVQGGAKINPPLN